MKLLDRVREVARLRHMAYSTEESYVGWIARYLCFSKVGETWRRPEEMGAAEVSAFLSHLATAGLVSASTQ